MLGSCDLVAFIATSDAARARSFYETTLGLRLVSDDAFALVFDANGTHLRVAKVDQPTVAPYTVLGWNVPGIEATARGLAARGVTFERFPGLSQDDLGIWTAPGGARVAWFKDPDGHLLSLTEG
jgi:catechol 2,3-dioxygenase-like lactoylglutathione lyase family enzyme